MKTCNCCGLVKQSTDFCDQNCKRRYYRGVPDKVHYVPTKVQHVPVRVQESNDYIIEKEVQAYEE